MRNHVFRWDRDPIELVFHRGFCARHQGDTPTEIYYNLDTFVHRVGKPLERIRDTTHAFVSTTLSGTWCPMVSGVNVPVYRYEVYAPGGILIRGTLGESYVYAGQHEVTFLSGIAPQYIRSARAFFLSRDGQFTRCIRANNILYLNRNFNPQFDPEKEIKILRPTSYYQENNKMKRLIIEEIPRVSLSPLDLTDIAASLPTEGLTMEERGGLVNERKVVSLNMTIVNLKLKPAVRKRVDVLRDIQHPLFFQGVSRHDEQRYPIVVNSVVVSLDVTCTTINRWKDYHGVLVCECSWSLMGCLRVLVIGSFLDNEVQNQEMDSLSFAIDLYKQRSGRVFEKRDWYCDRSLDLNAERIPCWLLIKTKRWTAYNCTKQGDFARDVVRNQRNSDVIQVMRDMHGSRNKESGQKAGQKLRLKKQIENNLVMQEVYVSQPPGFLDPKYPQKVYKVVKALYGLHQAPRAWYATLSTFLLKNGYKRGIIDKTLFIKEDKHDIILVQVYADDIIFGCTKKSWCDEFEALMKSIFQMSSMGELTFFLGLQVKQKEDGIFISQDKYVAEILKKFDFANVKTASTPIETQKPLVKDEEASDVDVHLYRSMIGSLMYLTASRPDIMFAVCACSRFQVTPKSSHLSTVKRIFRYLKGKPKLGLWYPRVSSFDLESYSDSDYAGANLDRKSTIGGCQFLGRRLISWQCKKQTIVATSTTEAEYVAAASCCGQVLWIQNQMLDYGFNFMNTKIYIDNESTICIVKNPVYHSKTKHIAIRHHFIRDAYEKKLIQVLKIHTDDNVADLLTKAFDVSRGLIEFRGSLRRVTDGTEALLIPTLFILWLDKVSTASAKLVPLGKVCTAIKTLKKNTAKALISLFTTISLSSTMAVLDSCPKHNMVAYLEKTEGNAEFHEIIDFLKRSSIHHALTVSPVVSTTFVEQFWTSAKSKTINNVRHITAKVAGKFLIKPTEIQLLMASSQSQITKSCKSFSKKHRVHKESISQISREEEGFLGGRKLWREEDKRNGGWKTKEIDEYDLSYMKTVVSTDKEVVSTGKEKVSTDKEKVSTDRPIVSTDESKISTDRQIEGTDEQIKGTQEHIEGTEEQVESIDGQRKGTEEHIEGTEEQIEGTKEHIKGTKEQVCLKVTDGTKKGTEDHIEEQKLSAQSHIKKTPYIRTHTFLRLWSDETILLRVPLNRVSSQAWFLRNGGKGVGRVEKILKKLKT
ncbi:putative ribonuclease H-like domain-containing protein [Tanacetum coccineum]